MRKFEELKIAVAGTGYVGLSIATLLSQHHQVTAVDVIPEKVDKIKLKTGPDYIFERDGILYVRTYDTNYEFTLN